MEKKAPPETLEGEPLRKLTDEFSRLKNGNWKTAPLSIGLAVIIVGGAFWLISWVSRGQMTVKNMAREAVEHHVDRDVDRAHPDLPNKYVKKQELKDSMHRVDKRLMNIDTNQKIIIKKLDSLNGNHRRRRHGR